MNRIDSSMSRCDGINFQAQGLGVDRLDGPKYWIDHFIILIGRKA